MAPTGKQKPETEGPAPATPLQECTLSKDVDLTPVLPWTASESNEHGRTLIWPAATAKRPASKTAGKKVENFRHLWVLMGLKGANPRLEVPEGLPKKSSASNSAKLSEPRAVPVLEHFSSDINAKRLIGGMTVKEFFMQRLAPNQAHSRPLFDYQLGDDTLRLRFQDLPIEELNRAMVTLLGGDPSDMPEALVPLYHLDDRADLIAALPVFNVRGLSPAEGSGPVEVSSDNTLAGNTRRRPLTLPGEPASPVTGRASARA
ncbi:hypothetical protein ZWY2020_037903 [Hordeum vulgare]|nr:hypothetical protein ZWY2020_037903 [Hordeum vulgare]